MRAAPFLAFGLLLTAGCGSIMRPSDEPPAMKANDLRAAILRDKSKLWKDPESIRDAENGPAYSCPRRFGGPGASCLCVRLNARNSFGGYTGLKETAIGYKNGTFVDAAQPDFDDACNSFYSFAELNGNYIPPEQRPISPPPKKKR